MSKALMLFALLVSYHCAGGSDPGIRFSDQPEHLRAAALPCQEAASYGQALQIWKTPEDINAWIAANFSYDPVRAVQLSESRRTGSGRLPVYHPSAFFEGKTGVCVDLARFALETLRSLDPSSNPKYLMIEFEPALIQGNTFRLHWLVCFRRDGAIYVFADSKRPGHMAGPYADPLDFIREYELYRGRRIVAFRELESYEQQRRTQARRRPAPR